MDGPNDRPERIYYYAGSRQFFWLLLFASPVSPEFLAGFPSIRARAAADVEGGGVGGGGAGFLRGASDVLTVGCLFATIFAAGAEVAVGAFPTGPASVSAAAGGSAAGGSIA